MTIFEFNWAHSLLVFFILLINSGMTNQQSGTGTSPSSFCYGTGRHPNTTDTTCQRYVYCSPNSTRTGYIAHPFICPRNYVFRPITSTCVRPAVYTCPTTSTSASTIPPSTTQDLITSSSTTSIMMSTSG